MKKIFYYLEKDIFDGKMFLFAKTKFDKENINPLFNDYKMEEEIFYELEKEENGLLIYKPIKAIRYLYENKEDDEKDFKLIRTFEIAGDKIYDFIEFNRKEIQLKNYEDRYLIKAIAFWEDDLPKPINKEIFVQHKLYFKKEV